MPDHYDAADPPHQPPHAAGAIVVRHIRSHDEFLGCVALQHAVWGSAFSERVPAALLKVAQRIGGVAAGAFDEHARLVGFVFGLTGVENGHLVHWSDMLAVREDMRDHGIGRRLKEFQRDIVRRLGVVRMYWTFDPLVARNAYFNLNRLGAHIVDYVPDMYGAETSSALHRGLGTDRFIVAWDIGGGAPNGREGDGHDERGAQHPPAVRHAPILNPLDASGLPVIPNIGSTTARSSVRIAVPIAIERVQAQSLEAAARWRASTRRAMLWALNNGYGVTGFFRDDDAGCCYYVYSPLPHSALAAP